MPVRRLAAGVIALAAAALVAAPGAAAATQSPCGRVAHAPQWKHVIVVTFENHSYADVLGSSAPPSEFKSLARQCGVATQFTASHFPHSLPTYIASTSGRVTITGDCTPGPACSSPDASIFSQLGQAGWRTFGESMPAPCFGANATPYVARHVPPLYYIRITDATCEADVRPLPASTPTRWRRFTWISPNEVHDMEQGSIGQASTWLTAFLEGPRGVLKRPPYTNGHTAVFIWFDTGGDTDTVATPLPFIVISPSTPHTTTARAVDDMSALRVWERMLGLPCLNDACSASGMAFPFHL
jgi:hypothetical protein